MQLVVNKKAQHDYLIESVVHAGVILSGPEVKSLRRKAASLKGSFVKPINGELFLLNAQISPYPFADNRDYDPIRTRKLLMKKKEIFKLLEVSSQKGWSLVPLSFEVVGRVIKVTIGLARGKKQFEKRADLKKKAIQRDTEREMKFR